MANVLAAANVIEHPTERTAAYHPVLKHSRRIGKADAPAKLRAGRYAAALEGQSDVSQANIPQPRSGEDVCAETSDCT